MSQQQIDRMLKWGFIFSVVWLGGFGSLAAFIIGIKTRKRIRESNGTLTGTGSALWCLIVGALGLAIWVPMILIGIINQF